MFDLIWLLSARAQPKFGYALPKNNVSHPGGQPDFHLLSTPSKVGGLLACNPPKAVQTVAH